MFWSRKVAPDDLKRVDRLEEQVESILRRLESMLVDLEEFYAKTNKARQRVVKEDRDAAGRAGALPETREMAKAQLRARFRLNQG